MISYQISPKNINAHIFEVQLKIENPNPLGQVFSLPNWIPGSYLVRDFSKHIISIKAHSGKQNIAIKKLDKNHWITQPCEKNITLIYEVYAFDLSVRCAYLSNQRAFFNGSSVFLYAIGFEDEPCEVGINYPTDLEFAKWSCATALTLKSKRRGAEVYSAKNYQDLIDSPVEIAELSCFKFEVNSAAHSMAISGKHDTDIKRLKADLKRICQHHIDFFGDVPFDNYLFLTLVTNKEYGGLEHKKSSSLICGRSEIAGAKNVGVSREYSRFLALCSHEYFHAWWVKTIKPASFHQLNMNHENYTEQLWIFEGFTSYYDELALLRAGILSAEQYLTLFAQTISKVQNESGRFKQSLAESSFDAWTKFYQQDENAQNAIVSYYTKGSLLAFVLDIEIRSRTKNTQSLDAALRQVWQNYQHSGLENDTMQKVVEYITQSDFSDFFDKYLYGTDDLPLQKSFDYIGIKCEFIRKKDQLSNFGFAIDKTQKPPVVTHIFANSCAQNFGLYAKDKIIKINGAKIDGKNLAKELSAYNEGDIVKVEIRRDELPVELKIKIKFSPKSHCILTPTQKNISRQKQWFTGEL